VDPHGFSVAIRWLHVAAMAIALGGAVLLAVAARGRAGLDGLLAISATYERSFWLAAGILVMSGIGNAAAFGIGLPEPASAWGAAFIAKLLLVALLVVASVPRTVAIVHLAALPASVGTQRTVATLYAVTALALLAILAFALRLAHG
jgi:hypothetical protein